MTTYAVGDVQGCLEPLQRLLAKVNFDADVDRLWLTGDLVNRGSDSLGVLRYVRSLGDRATVVLGNHDLHLLAVASGARAPKKTDTLNDILNAADREELLGWLKTRPLAHYDAALDFVMVHAGIPPQWDLNETLALAAEVSAAIRGGEADSFYAAMYGNEPSCWSETLSGTARLRVITNYLTRMRFCYPDGTLELAAKEGPSTAPAGTSPWYAHPQRKAAALRVIFGHWAMLNGKADTANVFALDTGCVYGGRLTALNLETLERTSCDCERSPGPSDESFASGEGSGFDRPNWPRED